MPTTMSQSLHPRKVCWSRRRRLDEERKKLAHPKSMPNAPKGASMWNSKDESDDAIARLGYLMMTNVSTKESGWLWRTTSTS